MISTLASAANTFFRIPAGTKPVAPGRRGFITGTFSILNRKEKTRFGFLIVADIIISIVDILSLALLLWIIQFYIQPGSKALAFLPAWMVKEHSVALIALFFLLFTVKNLAAFFISKSQYGFIGHVAVRISKNNLVNFQQSSYQEFVHTDSSVHLRKIAYQPYDFCQYMLSGIQQIITQASLIAIAIIAIILFNAKLFVLLLAILVPPVLVVFHIIKKRLTKAKWFIRKGNEKSFQYLMDALKGYVEANVYGRNHFFLNRFVAQRKNFSFHLFNSISIQTLPSRLIEIFAVMGLFILIVIARWTGTDHGALITIGAFMAAAYKIIPGLVKLVNITSQIKAYEFSLNELADDGVRDNGIHAMQVNSIRSLVFDRVCFSYAGTAVLKNCSLEIKSGDFVGITGRSGTGKTTLLNLVLGFIDPAAGKIVINDNETNSGELQQFWPLISYVRQQGFLIHDTILRNITLEEEHHDEERLARVLKISGVDEMTGNSQEGVHKVITENGRNISGGQQQRIALARALYKNADLILLDEPFNELDEASEVVLLRHFRELADNGKMVVMITHNRAALTFCNKILSLDEQ